MKIDSTLREQAADWAVRTGDPEFADWEAFTLWLEQDPAHGLAYDQVVAAVAEVAETGLLESTSPANDNPAVQFAAPRVLRRTWLGGAIAASLAIVAVVGILGVGGTSTSYVTAPGELRTVALNNGNSITLGGDTRLVLRGRNQDQAVLEQGQALFDLRHESEHPFELHTGEDVLRDIGTVFEVQRLKGTTSLAVAEGAVLFNPDRQKVRVDQGQRAVRRSGANQIETSAIPTSLIGEWREGRHTFRSASLAEVASALTRASGVPFSVAPDGSGKRISGSVLIEPIRRDPASLGPLLGVKVRAAGDGWILEP